MSEAKEIDTALPVTEFAFDKMEKYFDAAQEVIDNYGGDAVELGLNALRVDAAAIIIPHLVFIIVALIFLKYLIPLMKTGWREGREDGWSDFPAKCFAGTISVFAATIALLANITDAFNNIWAWVGIFYPELYAVHKFLL
jgi:hypothetical protein